MFLRTSSPKDAKVIAHIYKKAFPASIRLFFGKKTAEELLVFLELSFQFVFHWGGKGLLAEDGEGRPLGYCLYSKSAHRPNFPAAAKTAWQLRGKIKPGEVGRLTYNQVLKLLHRRTAKVTLKKGASIISIAVTPEFQGRGVGTFLLDEALEKLAQETVFLNVRQENRPARLLYKKAGFKTYGATKDLLGEWVMLKRPPSY